MHRRRGITRTVFVGRRWAVKVPSFHHRRMVVRGWLANRSEWKRRHVPGVARPLATVGHVLLVLPAAVFVGGEDMTGPWEAMEDGDDSKPMNWGWFDGQGWLLIDFDKAWIEPRGWVGGVYYWWQERKARRWIKADS